MLLCCFYYMYNSSDRMILGNYDLIRSQVFSDNTKRMVEVILICNYIRNMIKIGFKLLLSYCCLHPTIIILIMLSLIKTLKEKILNIRCLMLPVEDTNGSYNIIYSFYRIIVIKVIYYIVRRIPALHVACWFFSSLIKIMLIIQIFLSLIKRIYTLIYVYST